MNEVPRGVRRSWKRDGMVFTSMPSTGSLRVPYLQASVDNVNTHAMGSPLHSARSNSVTSMRDLPPPPPRQRRTSGRHRDRSLDRYQQFISDARNTMSKVERSKSTRDYPHMGARSLERDSSLHRSRSIDHEYFLEQEAASYGPAQLQSDYIQTRETLVVDLQGQIIDLTKECALLQNSLQVTKDKLTSSMNSIKAFWSPELKKERQLRKEETLKLNTHLELLRHKEAENKRLTAEVCRLEEEVRSDVGTLRDSPKHINEMQQMKENMDDLELKIEVQKQTLQAREASIRRLLGMLRTKVNEPDELERVQTEDRLREQSVQSEQRCVRLERLLQHKDKEISFLHDELKNYQTSSIKSEDDVDKRYSADILTMAAMLESKDAHLASLKKQVCLLEEELERIKATTADKDVEKLKGQLDLVQKSASDSERAVELMKQEISTRDQRIALLQQDLDGLQQRVQIKDQQLDEKTKQLASAQTSSKQLQLQLDQEINTARNTVATLQVKVAGLKSEVKDKDSRLQEMRSELLSVQQSQGSSEHALSAMHERLAQKDTIITKLREEKSSVEKRIAEESATQRSVVSDLNMKINQLQEQVVQLEKQLSQSQATGATLQSTGGQLQIQLDRVKQELAAVLLELSSTKDQRSQVQGQVKQLEQQLGSTQAQLSKASGEVAALQSELSRAKVDVSRAEEKVVQAEQAHKQATQALQASGGEMTKEVSNLKVEVQRKEEELTRTQAELDRLLDILRTTENEKNEKDTQIKDLNEQLKEAKGKLNNAKKERQQDSSRLTQMLEKAQQQEKNNPDVNVLKALLGQREERVEELEEALRESVRITAQREMLVHELETKVKQADIQMRTVRDEMELEREKAKESAEEASQLREQLQEKVEQLQQLQSERNSHLLDLYRLKQEAILATLTEKDAHIAFLEMTPAHTHTSQEVEKLTQEKHHLQAKLKDINESAMKLEVNNSKLNKKRSSSNILSPLEVKRLS